MNAIVAGVVLIGTLAGFELLAREIEPRLPIEHKKWPRKEMGAKYEQMVDLSRTDRSVGVLFAGSSMMASGIDPNAFTEASGVESYNSAFAGPGMTALTPWILDVAEPMLSPDTVVLGIQSRELNGKSGEIARFHTVLRQSPGFEVAAGRTLLDRLERWFEYSSAFFRNRRAFRSPFTMFEEKGVIRQHRVGPRGTRLQPTGTYHGVVARAGQGTGFRLGEDQLEALDRLARALNARDVGLVLIAMPVTGDYGLARPRVRERFFEVLSDWAIEREATVIDAQDAYPSVDPFRDPIHLDTDARVALGASLGRSWSEIVESGGPYLRLECAEDMSCEVSEIDELTPKDSPAPGRRSQVPAG